MFTWTLGSWFWSHSGSDVDMQHSEKAGFACPHTRDKDQCPGYWFLLQVSEVYRHKQQLEAVNLTFTVAEATLAESSLYTLCFCCIYLIVHAPAGTLGSLDQSIGANGSAFPLCVHILYLTLSLPRDWILGDAFSTSVVCLCYIPWLKLPRDGMFTVGSKNLRPVPHFF